MNPILQNLQLKNQEISLNNIGNMYQQYKNTPNPQALLQGILGANPMLQQILKGGNLKETYYRLCDQKNVDPNIILNQLKKP